MKPIEHLQLLSSSLAVTGLLLQAAPALGAPSLQEAFRDASHEFNVPAELLMGVSYTTTSWYNARGFDRHSAREFGVMGLRMQEQGPSLVDASALLDVPVEQVRDDQAQNIRGAAALLAQYAREANDGRPVPADLSLETAAAWWAATSRYAGVADARHQDMFAAHVFETLEQGAEGRAESGELVRLAPAVLPSIIGDWIDFARYQNQRQIDATSPQTDYSGAAWVPACSSNYTNDSRTAADISYVVIHKIEGSYSGCISWFQNCSAQVSAHYVVSKYGEVTQMVKEEDIAWHAGNWDYNVMSVGIEHEGYTANDDVTEAEYQGSAALTRDVCDRNGIPKNRDYIIGHNEVPGATHTDPGPYWDWNYYMSLVGCTGDCGGGGGGGDTGNLVGYIREDDIYSGAGIAGATVTLSGGAGSTTTDSNGYYKFTDIAAGTYTITADADCYAPNSITKTVEASIDNWGSIALTADSSCGSDGGPGCTAMAPDLHPTRIHTASTSPLDRLPWSSAGFVVSVAGALMFWRRRGR